MKTVSDGFARNFLLPRKLADIATAKSEAEISARRKTAEEESAKEKSLYESIATTIQATPLRFTLKVGERGRAFGSVTSEDIRLALASSHITVQKDWLKLDQPIKTTGEHAVPIHFPQGVTGTLHVAIEPVKERIR